MRLREAAMEVTRQFALFGSSRVWVDRVARAILLVGLAVHLGTAVLRLDVFLPSPRLIDFAGFYAAAYALRQGLSPYAISSAWRSHLAATAHIFQQPPPVYNPLLWIWLLQPLTCIDYPTAAGLWLVLNLCLLAGCILALLDLSTLKGVWGRLLGALVIATYGPVVLDLSLGQTSVVLLAAMLVVGRGLATVDISALRGVKLMLAMAFAAGAKLYPMVWPVPAGAARRWRAALLMVVGVSLGLGVGFLISRRACQAYWTHDLPQRLHTATSSVGMDDQSLSAWLQRMLLPQHYMVPALRVNSRLEVEWRPPWTLELGGVRRLANALALMVGLGTLGALVRWGHHHPELSLYFWNTCLLVMLPHIERYNHVLLLPALAWLWGQGGGLRLASAVAYGLLALSRLNHLWLIALPYPWAPLLSGAGVGAALIVVVSVGWALAHWTEGLGEGACRGERA